MKVFMREHKINFVDENNVYLGYDLYQNCCESADWFIADTPQETVPEHKRDTDDPDLEGFVFDTSFFKDIRGNEFDEGGMAIFRIVNGATEKFVHIYNSHNGFYSHGFEFKIGETTAQEGDL